jgi:choline dehydrogenase-like flavoprotein
VSQTQSSDTVHDVVIIGSGAGGGTATKVLADLGISVLLMEAGPMLAMSDLKEHLLPYHMPHRGAGPKGEAYTGGRAFTYSATYGGAQLDGEPYTVAPGSDFSWFRSRILGGRTNHYGRVTLRFSDYDFRPRSSDGLGFDWPITYDDLKPYYDKVDTLVGIFGSKEGLPNEPDGLFQPAPRPRCYELLIKQAADRLKVTCIASRLSILTQPLNGRPACHYCGQCGRGCAAHANFSTPSVLLPPAQATGKLTLVTGAMAREVTVDSAGLADGVAYIDKATGRENHVRARIVVLAASA